MMAPIPESRLSVPVAPRYSSGDLVAGKYLLERVLGNGGMGSVWLAHNMDLDAPVAIKLIGGDTAPGEAADRLKREARAEARLEHRAVVRVFDCGETERGDPFIVMEMLEGMSFADALDQKKTLGALSAVRVLLPIIDGLCAAHDEGIVHRDVKPENIFLSRGARYIQPKIVDFGIAKLDRWDPNPRITMQGTVIGSPAYMAPEQARGLNDVDHRADIWAVCVVLYEAVTGSLPFRGDSYNAILRRIVEDEVTPLSDCGPIQAALWPILEHGFTKERATRFQTMRDLGIALAQFLVDHGVTEDICGDSLFTTWGVAGERAETDPRDTRPVLPPRHGKTPSMSELVEDLFPASGAKRHTPGPLSFAPTSLSHITGLSGLQHDRRRGVLVPVLAAAAITLLAIVGVGVRTQRLGAPVRSAAAAALTWVEPSVAQGRSSTNPPAPSNRVLAPPLQHSTLSAAAAEPAAVPTKTPLITPAAVASAGHRANKHGWPAPLTAPKTRQSSPPINDLRALDARASTISDDTLHTLGLKAPYR